MRNFEKWLGKFKNSIATYDYYIDLKKVIKNVRNIKIELNILNSLIGSKNIEEEFENIIKEYPKTLKCIPILLAVRDTEIYAQDEEGSFLYNFKTPNYTIEQYKIFMRKTGLFDLIQNHIINNLVDYVLGVETGLDSNGRKNRGGHLMEDLVEKYIVKAGFIKGVNYFKEMKISEIEEKFKSSIATYDYYIDFEKVIKNINNIKIELNILNSLIGSKNIEEDFVNIIKKYPETLKCIPILLAVRDTEIYAQDEEGSFLYNFKTQNYSVEQYKIFMRKTGLFNLIQNHIINNLVDYVLGVETGLDSNGRKNRGGHLMEDLVEKYIVKAGFVKGVNYFKEMKISEIEEKFKIDLSHISNKGKTVKRFDFVVKTENMIYAIETNFYASSGSKLNETARSYKQIAQEAKNINGFTFVWFTDGKGWIDARNNLEETFEILETIYNIHDMENDIMRTLFR